MNSIEKYTCVVDTQGRYVDFVLQILTPQMDGTEDWKVQHYALKPGERLVDAMPPTRKTHAGASGLVRPRWDEDTTAWVEGATAEEIAAWELAHPAPPPAPPTAEEDRDAMLVDLEYRTTLLELGVN